MEFRYIIFICLILIQGCTSYSHSPHALDNEHWQTIEVEHPLPAVGKLRGESKTLHVFIEGDGMAFVSRYEPSPDPTPIWPTALMLAQEHDAEAVGYIGRPCQYVTSGACTIRHWTHGRFSEIVMMAENHLLDEMKFLAGAEELVLYGYSGGGAVAAILAARRPDVIGLVTICGNMDHRYWTEHHDVSPLTTSLNPKTYVGNLAHIKQIHFVGGADDIVPLAVVKSFTDNLPDGTEYTIVLLPELGHGGIEWVAVWDDLMDGTFPSVEDIHQ